MPTFASQSKIKRVAQMAESVDALVSNTSGVTSIPVRPRVWVLKRSSYELLFFLFITFGHPPPIGEQRKMRQSKSPFNPNVFSYH